MSSNLTSLAVAAGSCTQQQTAAAAAIRAGGRAGRGVGAGIRLAAANSAHSAMKFPPSQTRWRARRPDRRQADEQCAPNRASEWVTSMQARRAATPPGRPYPWTMSWWWIYCAGLLWLVASAARSDPNHGGSHQAKRGRNMIHNLN